MILLGLLFVLGAAASCPPRLSHELSCPQGCYHASGTMNSDGTRPCSPVGVGHYSPPNDNRRYLCEFGTYSATDVAENCSSCPAGTHSSTAGATQCDICPPGSYSNLPRSIFCSPCNPENYDGEGSDTIQVWSGKIYCAFSGVTNKKTTPSPTNAPTLATTEASTSHESSTWITSSSLNETISLLHQHNNDDNQVRVDQCLSLEYKWHDRCTECPSTIRTILHPIWIAMIVLGVIVCLHFLPNSLKTIIWIGIEYLQHMYFLGLVPSTQPSHFVIQHLQRWIVAAFALDLDAGFSWQCLMGLSPELDQLLVLVFPLVMACLLWMISQGISAIPVGSWLAIGFSLGQFKFIITSLEALHCSGNEWFCHKPLLSSICGIVGLAIYGGLVPIWLLWHRFSCSKHADALANSPLGFDNCWWWPGFWMLRKGVLATLPLVLSSHPSWNLTVFLVTLMATELLQRFASPFSGEDSRHNRWFRTNTVDTILQASIIGLTGLCFLNLAMPNETLRADGITIVVFFLTIWIPTVLYWMVAVLYGHCYNRSKNQMEEVTSVDDVRSSTSASSASSQQRQLQRSESIERLPLPPPSIQSVDETAIRHNLSIIPHSGPGDDLEIESIPGDEEIGISRRAWREAREYSEWAGTQDLNIRSVLRGKPIDIHLEDYHSSSCDDSLPLPPAEYDNDDTSTLTGNNSYAPKGVPRYRTTRRVHMDCGSSDVISIMESSGDGTPMIFVDDEDAHVEYHESRCYSRENENAIVGSGGDDGDDEDDDDMTEIWIDEATGMPIDDKQSGQWADAQTGLPIDSSSSSSSSSWSSTRLQPRFHHIKN